MRPQASYGSGIAVLIVAGCVNGAPPDASSVEVRDSVGITIVQNGALDLSRELLATPGPVLEIGVVDGPEELQFFQVSDVKRLPDGGFAVTNGGSRELRIFDSDGTPRATAGGPGQGPSEFGYPMAIRILANDTIVVQDRIDRVLFTVAGDFVRRETTTRQALDELTARIGGNSEGGQWMSDGTFFAPVYQWDQNPPIAGPPFRPSMTFVRVSQDFAAIDTLGEFGGILQQYVDIGEEHPSATVPPFSTNTSWGLSSADGTVVAADNAVPQVEVFSPSGAHTIVRWNGTAELVAAAEAEAWKERQRNASWAQRRLPQLERAWASMDVPEVKPYYGRATTGSDGRIWLGPVESQGQGWMAFEPDGRFLGVAGVPGTFTPMDSGQGWLLGVHRDENEVEFVRLYALATS